MSNDKFRAAHERVKGFFEGEISQYLIADLQRMAKIQDAPHLTIPESLAVFSALAIVSPFGGNRVGASSARR
jgi:hypothetical protein